MRVDCPYLTKAGPVLLLIFTSHTCAQSLPCSHRTAWISVTDQEGTPISGLQISDFQGEYRGKAVKILSLWPDQLGFARDTPPCTVQQ